MVDWWRGFRSGELTSLMDAAQVYNLDIAVAIAQIVQADAQVGVSGAPLLPTLTGNASAERQKQSSANTISSGQGFGGTTFNHVPDQPDRELHGRFLGQEPGDAVCGGRECHRGAL